MADLTDIEKQNRPLSYIDWVRTAGSTFTSESNLLKQYNEYITSWYKTKNLQTSDEKTL